jgi:hypothetical protein
LGVCFRSTNPTPSFAKKPKGGTTSRPGFFLLTDMPRAVSAPRIEAPAAGIRRDEPG